MSDLRAQSPDGKLRRTSPVGPPVRTRDPPLPKALRFLAPPGWPLLEDEERGSADVAPNRHVPSASMCGGMGHQGSAQPETDSMPAHISLVPYRDSQACNAVQSPWDRSSKWLLAS